MTTLKDLLPRRFALMVDGRLVGMGHACSVDCFPTQSVSGDFDRDELREELEHAKQRSGHQ